MDNQVKGVLPSSRTNRENKESKYNNIIYIRVCLYLGSNMVGS